MVRLVSAVSTCAAIALAGCGQTDANNSASVAAAPSGLAAEESASIISEGGKFIAERTYYEDGGLMYCSNYFSLGNFTIGETLLQGTEGKVVINYVITARKPIPHFGGDYFPNKCYGEPPGGWSIGKVANGQDELKLERWQTGWRLARQQ